MPRGRKRRGNTPTYIYTDQLDITIEEGLGWTHLGVSNLIGAEAYQLDLLEPVLRVDVQTDYPSSTSTSASTSGGIYTAFRAHIYLRPSYEDDAGVMHNQVFSTRPQSTVAHEYGHAWTMYHLYLTQNANWDKWLEFRGLLGNPLLDTAYKWMKGEMIADDYRLLFGSSEAITQAGYINNTIEDPRNIPGYREWFETQWAQ